ncbi:tetraspanin-33 isoform X1 [Stigmatopora argus]
MRGYRGVKYFLFIFCYVFWVLSAILIAVGIYAKVAKEKDVVDTLTVDPALLLMAVGSLTFSIAFLGCFGALRNAICLLKTFASILAALLLLQLTAGILGYVFTEAVGRRRETIKGGRPLPGESDGFRAGVDGGCFVVEVMERTRRLMMKTVLRYREDRDLENAIDFVQKKLQCCGVDGYKDWSRNVYFQCSDSNPSLEACGVPFSCCVPPANQTVPNTMCGFGTQLHSRELAERHVFPDGCADKIAHWLGQNVKMAAGLAGGLLLLEVCVMSLAWAQACWIHKVRRRHRAALASKSASHKKEDVWLPAFADFDAQ